MTEEDAGWLGGWKESGVDMRCQAPPSQKIIHLQNEQIRDSITSMMTRRENLFMFSRTEEREQRPIGYPKDG